MERRSDYRADEHGRTAKFSIKADKFDTIWIAYQVAKQAEIHGQPMEFKIKSGSLESFLIWYYDEASEVIAAKAIGAIIDYIRGRIENNNEISFGNQEQNALRLYAIYYLDNIAKVKYKGLESERLTDEGLEITVRDHFGAIKKVKVTRSFVVTYR